MGMTETAAHRSTGYQVALTALLSLNFGILFFDRNALNFLGTFVKADLGLNNDQVGTIAALFSFTWALAAFGIGRVVDRVGNPKLVLVIATLAFCACSFLSGLASTFAFMVGARMLMGVAEGGVMPISHAFVSAEVAPEHRGLAQGIAQNFGSNFFGSFVAPVALVWVAQNYGWQNAFFIAGVPGIISAMLLWIFIKPPLNPIRPAAESGGSLGGWWTQAREVLKVRNVWISVVMGILLVAYLVTCWAFMQLFLTSRGVSASAASWLMSALGISATIGSFAISGLSDRIGRRPVMIAMPLIAALLPLGAMYWTGSLWVMAAIFFVGWGVNGIFPLFMATVPSESVRPEQVTVAFGLAMGASEIFGGVLGPKIAGMLADAHGQAAPLWLMLGVCLVAAVFALGLKESAPRVLARQNP
jgi:predicted MFS family arabinose efflux permease